MRQPAGAGEQRFYADLATWWPLISPVEEYAEEAAYAAGLLNSASIPVRKVLELGSGGGHNAYYLKSHFTMTLVDLSEEMLAVSRRLSAEEGNYDIHDCHLIAPQPFCTCQEGNRD